MNSEGACRPPAPKTTTRRRRRTHTPRHRKPHHRRHRRQLRGPTHRPRRRRRHGRRLRIPCPSSKGQVGKVPAQATPHPFQNVLRPSKGFSHLTPQAGDHGAIYIRPRSDVPTEDTRPQPICGHDGRVGPIGFVQQGHALRPSFVRPALVRVARCRLGEGLSFRFRSQPLGKASTGEGDSGGDQHGGTGPEGLH
jgi:hypothetical protein